jgi:hypothetical protein
MLGGNDGVRGAAEWIAIMVATKVGDEELDPKGVSPIIEELTASKGWQRVRRVCRASLESSFPEPFTT